MLYECSTCPQVLCDICLVVPSGSPPASTRFTCPSCHEKRDRAKGREGKRAFRPYEVNFLLDYTD